MRPGEPLEGSLRRAGVAAPDAIAAARLVATDAPYGGVLEVALAPSPQGTGGRLLGMSLPGGQPGPLTWSRAYDGTLRPTRPPASTRAVTTVAEGALRGSFFDSAERAGADPALIEQAANLFSHKLDLARDLAAGDRFRLVFRRTMTPAGDTVETGALLYAEISGKGGVSRFYAFDDGGGTQFLDDGGRPAGALLLRTPVQGARISSIFGMRLHPILGYSRMHQGVDFAAPLGAPVVAAGDGVVTEARSWGGYGRWLRIRHADGWETGYAHLAAYAAGVRPGLAVHQGQVVAFVGESGEATGPHLHYEVWRDGVRVDPATIPPLLVSALPGDRLARFEIQRAYVDSLLARAAVAGARDASGLRPRLAANTSDRRPAIRLFPEV